MLLRPDATFLDPVTDRAERIFPRGEDWLHFESKLPGESVFANAVLEPAVGITDELAIETFAKADWSNWISATKISLFEVGTRIGLTPSTAAPIKQSLAQVYTNVEFAFAAYQGGLMPEELIPELLKNSGLQALQQLTGQSTLIAQTVAQVLAAAVWAADVLAAHRASELQKHVALPPLQAEDPATDTWQVNRVFEAMRRKGSGGGGLVYPDGGLVAASNADYTSFYMPAYRHDKLWNVQYRSTGITAQQGDPLRARGPRGEVQYRFDIGDGSTFGFMPGTTTTLRVLQASHRYYQTVRGTPVDRYALRCRGVDKPCWQSPKSFDGSKDCRQCVHAESVWPTKGLGWAYGGAPLNATTPGENVGAFYPSLNKLLLNLLESIVRPGPLLFTVDFEAVHDAWKSCFEAFWSFARSQWQAHHGPGWRGLLSRLATLMTAFGKDDGLVVGGRLVEMPSSLIESPREPEFEIPFHASIFEELIAPYCRDAAKMQMYFLDTLEVAYIPPGAGALYRPSGRLRANGLAKRFLAARQALLASTKRMHIDLRRVSDPEYRSALAAAGVKASNVNQQLWGSPGIGHELLTPSSRPARAPRKPRRASGSPLAGLSKLAAEAPKPKRQAPQGEGSQGSLVGLGVGLGVATAAAVATVVLTGTPPKTTKSKPEP
ncbi:hypothetical protein PPSIR1_38029 [Plesiocystis pacifica SIR-1]|uniref:Uncharacterized protein n=1 Tax=Plesiocystis pacifica SIR-1 TaxID=391625 RepID=A6G9P5_9BACT|nr:hypothetical protein [Plesiocystis pacifica]EDM77439.1 hypothetical protein PPSIR1_38029 [Plesiocystis pacifica SIR-1]